MTSDSEIKVIPWWSAKGKITQEAVRTDNIVLFSAYLSFLSEVL